MRAPHVLLSLSILALALILAPVPIVAHAQTPLYAFQGNETWSYRVKLEAKMLGSLAPGHAIHVRLHAEANHYCVGYGYSPASVTIGPVKIALEIEDKLTWTLTHELHAYLRVYKDGRKVYEKELAKVGFCDKVSVEASIVATYSCDGTSLDVEVVAGDARYTTSVSMNGKPVAILGEAQEMGLPYPAKGWVKVENTARIDCRSDTIDWGSVKPGEGVNPGGDSFDPEKLSPIVNKALIAMVGVAALFALPLFIIAARKR